MCGHEAPSPIEPPDHPEPGPRGWGFVLAHQLLNRPVDHGQWKGGVSGQQDGPHVFREAAHGSSLCQPVGQLALHMA